MVGKIVKEKKMRMNGCGAEFTLFEDGSVMLSVGRASADKKKFDVGTDVFIHFNRESRVRSASGWSMLDEDKDGKRAKYFKIND